MYPKKFARREKASTPTEQKQKITKIEVTKLIPHGGRSPQYISLLYEAY